jgi:hypothetical protein
MNQRQVLILWVIAGALGAAVATTKIIQNPTTGSATKRSAGQTLLENFPAGQVATIEIASTEGTATLAKKGENWTVANRDGYPANNTFVNGLLRTIDELKVTQGMEAGPSFAPRFGMDPEASDADTRGITVSFRDSAEKDVATISVGRNIQSQGAAPSPFGGGGSVGRFVRNHADESGFYAVGEMFPTLSGNPARWLSQDFISVEKIQTITVSRPGGGENAWSLTRDDENAEFRLTDAQPGETLDSAGAAPLKSFLSYARFEDVIPAAEVDGRLVADKTATATITTFEGFTYALQITPIQPDATTADEDAPASSDRLAVTVNVSAELPEKRKPEEGESEEDAKAKDEAFASRLEALTEKLEKEKSFEGRTYEMATYSFEALLKERADLLATGEEPQAGAPQPVTPPMLLPPGGTSVTTEPIQAFTPPISIPPLEEEAGTEEEEAPAETEPQPEAAEEAPAEP